MSKIPAIAWALPWFATLTFCASSRSEDVGMLSDAEALDGRARDAGPANDAMVGTDGALHDAVPSMDGEPTDAFASDALPMPLDASTVDSGALDAMPLDAMPPDAGCLPPLANCDGTGLTCEVNTSTNSRNCGACGHDCLGASCMQGYCASTTGARGDGLQHAMAAGVAYATNTNALPPSDYYIGRLTNQGTIYEQIASGNGAPGGVLADANYVYFAISGTPSTVYRKAHTASATAAPEVLFQTASFPAWMVIRSGTLYWMTGDYLNATVYKRAMNAPAMDLGTQITTVGEPRVSSFVATSTTLYWMVQTNTANTLRELSLTATVASDVPNAPNPGLGMAVPPLHADANRVYWGGVGNQAGVYAYYAGGSVVRLSDLSAQQVYADPLSDQLYFGDPSNFTPLYRMSRNGGTPVEISASFLGGDLAGSDAQYIYAFPGWGSSISVYRYLK
jgi:hypothetical protein